MHDSTPDEPENAAQAVAALAPNARAAWARPKLRHMPAEIAETGVNSTADGTNTFS